MLPATNEICIENEINPFTYDEFIRLLGILYMMEVLQLPELRMYWLTEAEEFFPGLSSPGTAMKDGGVLCIDKSMLKSYHKGLNGLMEIRRKHRPIGNELKTMSNASTHVALDMELHVSNEDMQHKDFVDEYGATTA